MQGFKPGLYLGTECFSPWHSASQEPLFSCHNVDAIIGILGEVLVIKFYHCIFSFVDEEFTT